jgi:heterotetrameric sarcosine oxidase gamma subunit
MRTRLRRIDVGGIEVQGSPLAIAEMYPSSRPLRAGRVLTADDAWWCVVSPETLLVISRLEDRKRLEADLVERSKGGDARIADVTGERAAICLNGPFARDVLTRAGAAPLPPGRLLLESVSGVPTMVIHKGEESWLMVVPEADVATVWRTLSEAGASLGLASEGVDALQHQPAAANG